ncbi:hypothetical protein B0H14DRAFT_3874650 [Mycena olivaceomarginata]|nr:hypothetical protein B0H14DRAFT_3874650 [Mycena olivaceomarginata]
MYIGVGGNNDGRKAAPGDVANQEHAAADIPSDAAVSTDTVAGLRARIAELEAQRDTAAQPPMDGPAPRAQGGMPAARGETEWNPEHRVLALRHRVLSPQHCVFPPLLRALPPQSTLEHTSHTRMDDHEHAPELLKTIPKPRGRESIQIGMRLARSIEGNTLYGTARCVSHADMDIAVPWDKQPLEKRALVINAAKGKVTYLQYMENDWTTQASSDRKYLAANIPIRQPPQLYLNTLTSQPINSLKKVPVSVAAQPLFLKGKALANAKLVKEYPLADDDTSSSSPLYLKLPPCPTPTPNFDPQYPRLRPDRPIVSAAHPCHHTLRRPLVLALRRVALYQRHRHHLTLDADDDGGSLPSEEVSACLAEGAAVFEGGDGIGRDVVTGPVCFVPRVVSFRLSRPIGWARSSSGFVASHVLRLASCLLPSPHPSLYHFLSPRLVPPSLPPRLSPPLPLFPPPFFFSRPSSPFPSLPSVSSRASVPLPSPPFPSALPSFSPRLASPRPCLLVLSSFLSPFFSFICSLASSSLLPTSFPSPPNAARAWEDFLRASKGSLTASEVARTRDRVGVSGMAGT